tara:strand:+ start:2176 stop:2412 length:237 start_codon:yes stop_codon:yes gene_type:complete
LFGEIDTNTVDELENPVPFVVTVAVLPPEVEEFEIARITEEELEILSEKSDCDVSSRKRPVSLGTNKENKSPVSLDQV